jgi:transposase
VIPEKPENVFTFNRNARSRSTGIGVHVEPECVFILGRNMHPDAVIRVDEIWLSREPLDMRAGPDTALARVIQAFGAARPHCAYVFANKRANRVKVLVCDGFGIWLAARRLHQGRFVWTALRSGDAVAIDARQLQALVVGLPWRYAAANHVIDRH